MPEEMSDEERNKIVEKMGNVICAVCFIPQFLRIFVSQYRGFFFL